MIFKAHHVPGTVLGTQHAQGKPVLPGANFLKREYPAAGASGRSRSPARISKEQVES